jgi:hypothetical protein
MYALSNESIKSPLDYSIMQNKLYFKHTLGSRDSTKLWDWCGGISSHVLRSQLSAVVVSVVAILEEMNEVVDESCHKKYGCRRPQIGWKNLETQNNYLQFAVAID